MNWYAMEVSTFGIFRVLRKNIQDITQKNYQELKVTSS
jgi:hypothetical protein